MKKSHKIMIALLVLGMGMITIAANLLVLHVPEIGTSAYGACRTAAMHTKGYDVWRYLETEQQGSKTWIHFSDGTNDMNCEVYQIGSFWVVEQNLQSLVGLSFYCPENYSGCPRDDYHGVSP